MGIFDLFKKKPAPANTSFEPENMLEKILMKAATDPAFRMDFYRQLMASTIYIITDKAKEGRYTAKEGDTMSIMTLSDGSIPVFTSLRRIFDKNVIKEEVHYAEIPLKGLLEMTAGAKLLVNPFSAYSKELLPGEIARLLDGSIFERGRTIRIEKETAVQIGQPAVYPTEFIASLQKLYANTPAVKAAYLGWIYAPSSGDPPHYIIAIDTERDYQTICRDTGMTFEHYSKPQELLDIVQLDNSGLADYFTQQTQPFYKR